MSSIEIFQEEHPSLESYWRSVILFGRNVATYKFALAKSLLEIAPTGKTKINLEDLAVPFSKNICQHLLSAPKQVTSNSSEFIDACIGFNEGNVSYDELIRKTVQKGFNNVIDAFHIVNSDIIPIEFYVKEYRSGSKKIILTDEIFKLKEGIYFEDFNNEIESRWKLVETAWEIGIARDILNVQYDSMNKLLFINDEKIRRKNITSARDALNGYQKGKCFYCFRDVTLNPNDNNLCDVDHFYPHLLQTILKDVNLNGVWNLVLTCQSCNRGYNGKFAKAPAIKYLERIHRRDEYLISSHHPLKETLINQMGQTKEDRIKFLKSIDKQAINILAHRWETETFGEQIF